MRSLRQIAKRRRSMPFGIVHGIGIRNFTVGTDHNPDTRRFFLIGIFCGTISDGDRFIDVAQKFAWIPKTTVSLSAKSWALARNPLACFVQLLPNARG